MEEGRQGTEFHEGSGVRLYQQNISVGLDPGEVMSQAREFESTLLGQAQAAVQETRNQVRDEAMQFGASVVHQAQSQVHEAQAIAKAAAAAAVEQARAELRLEVQQRERLFQQKENDLMAQIRALQSEVTILRHQNLPQPISPSTHSLNGAELVSTIAELRAEVQDLRGSMIGPQQLNLPLQRGVGTSPPAASNIDPRTPADCGFGPVPPASGSPGSHNSSHRSARSRQSPPIAIASSIRQNPSPQGSPIRHDPYSDGDSSESELREDFGYPFPPPDPPPDPSPHGSQGSHHSAHSRGVGSNCLLSEEDVYKHKDLSLIKVDALPKDAAQFRSWKNAFVTRVCAIDRTGTDTLLRWLLPAFETAGDMNLSNPQGLPRFDAHLASLLADPKHLHNELGLQLQGYIEGCQLQYTAPRGRVLLNMVARRFFLDQRRGANLTEQALLELQLDTFSYQSLLAFANRVEYILNSIPPEHQPSEQTKFTWLFGRLKKCRLLQRHIDRIKDAREGSRVRTWAWLFGKLKDLVAELREDANETAIKDSLNPPQKQNQPDVPRKTKEQKEKERRNRAQGGAVADPQHGDTQPAAPAKPKGKTPGTGKGDFPGKGPGKGKKGGKGKGGDGGTKGAPNKPPPPPKHAQPEVPKNNQVAKEKAPCLFYPKGTCNRPNCPFAHIGPGKAKSGNSGATAKATVAATVAAVLPTAASGHSSCHNCQPASSRGFGGSFLGKILRWFMGWYTIAMPAIIPSVDVALPSCQTGPFQVEWIADSGAGRNLTSLKALAKQGVGPSVGISATRAEPVRFATGNGLFTATEVIHTIGSEFGESSSYLMADCPIVRSMGELVNHHGRPFVWLPGSLPFFLPDSSSVVADQYGNFQFSSKGAVHASRLDGNVPIFTESIEFATPAEAASSSSPARGVADPEPVPVPDAPADSEDEGEEPAAKEARLIREAASVEHRLAHFPKNPACKVCTQARMYARKVARVRQDPLHDRGSLPPTAAFGERLAADIVVVFKESSKDERETTLLVVRDEFSGFLRSFPLTRRTTDNVVRCLLQFIGKHAEAKPTIMFKSDNAKELDAACQQMSWVPEPTLANRWPHNSVLERDIRSIQEITRAVHLQAGFAIRPGLWSHSAVFGTFVLNLKHSIAGQETTRYIAATGTEFPGRKLLLGQLVYYRTDPKLRDKFEPSASPALFCGYRLDSGPESFKGVYLVLDYKKVKAGSIGADLAISVPFEELFVPEGEEVFPMRAAFERAIEGFAEPKFPDIKGLEVPFSPLGPDSTPAKRHEYITLDRLIKYGGTPGCKACQGDSVTHSPVCKVRFDGLIRADKTAESRSKSLPPTPVSLPPTPAPAVAPPTPGPSAEPKASARDADSDHLSDYAPSDDGAGIGAVASPDLFVPDTAFLARDRQFRRSNPNNNNQIVEYCCDDDSEIGLASVLFGVDCLRLGMSTLDLANAAHVEQAKGQVKPGSPIWLSIPCTEHTPWQRMNIHKHGPAYQDKLKKRQTRIRRMIRLAIDLAEEKLREGSHVSAEWPRDSLLWQDPDWLAFEQRANLRRVHFHGCALGVRGPQSPIKKPWCVSTTSLRVLQLFGQRQCDGTHVHEPAEGSKTRATGHYTKEFAHLVIEAFFPQRFYRSVPSLRSDNALVTKNLARSEWLKDQKGLEAVEAEGVGLRSNSTWDDDTVRPLWQLKKECRASGRRVQIAELLTLCGVKHFELHPSQHKYKGRIVFRGDQVRDADGNPILFGSEETATTPTGLVGLAACLFFGLRPGNGTSIADAIQAYLQAAIGNETWVLIPWELWLPSWRQLYPAETRLVVQLRKSLYGHPESGRRWQNHLWEQLRKIGGRESPAYPSTWIFGTGPQTLVLNVYVDDLTLSGPVELHASFWNKLRGLVKLDPEIFVKAGAEGCRILGRHHSVTRSDAVATCEFDMVAYTQQLVDFYCEITGVDKQKLRKVPSPAFPESQVTDQELETTGDLHGTASRILMRALWLSRLARPDISFIITRLASKVSRWDKFDDRQLLRCISYLHHSSHVTLKGSVSQVDTACQLEVYTDADFASCPLSSKSTSGIFVVAKTGDCVFPLHWVSRKQSSTARSTTEAETISLATAMFSEVENLQGHLAEILGFEIPVHYMQDNSTVITILKAGYSAKLRHMPRVHRVNVASVSERLTEPNVQITFCPTKEQRANGFTKVISPQEWSAMLEQLCLSSNDAVAAPAQGLRSEDPLAGTDPESVAGILPHRLTEQHILQLFCLLPCDDASRAVISTEGRCFTTGAFAHGGGIIGLRTNTHKFRGVTAVLTRFVRQQAKGLSFTAVAVFHGCQFQLHSDKYNDPASYNYVYPLTRVDGGQIWVADPAGEDQCPEHSCNLAGKILELPALFRPTIKHCTVPWTGATDARVVLVAFTPRVPHELSVSDRRVLIELGFRVPCSS